MTALSKALDWVHAHKKWLGVVLAFVAYGLQGIGYHKAGDLLLTFAAVTGIGYLPNGPNPKG